MSEHNDVGREGENIATNFLIQKGYKIITRNWHYGPKEIDIVARDGDTRVFVEVKTRSTLAFELPQEAVTKKKMRNLVEAADAYMIQNNIDLEGRFDIVGVLNGTPTMCSITFGGLPFSTPTMSNRPSRSMLF